MTASGPVKAVEGCLNQRSHDTAHGNLIPALIRLAIMLHPQSEYNNLISLTQSIQSTFVLKGNVAENIFFQIWGGETIFLVFVPDKYFSDLKENSLIFKDVAIPPIASM